MSTKEFLGSTKYFPVNDPENTKKYDMYVFNPLEPRTVSQKFKMPLDRCTVIKNGIDKYL